MWWEMGKQIGIIHNLQPQESVGKEKIMLTIVWEWNKYDKIKMHKILLGYILGRKFFSLKKDKRNIEYIFFMSPEELVVYPQTVKTLGEATPKELWKQRLR